MLHFFAYTQCFNILAKLEYLKNTQPDLKGFDRSGIYRMVKFHETYSPVEFVASLPSQLEIANIQSDTIVASLMTQLKDERKVVQLLSLINWTSHLEILSSCKSDEERIFYILLAHKERLSVRNLRRQIESSVYEIISMFTSPAISPE